MNLIAYDKIHELDRTKDWICLKNKQLITKTIKYRKYYTFGKIYDSIYNSYNIYLILLDERPVDRKSSITFRDDYGRLKFNLLSIWKLINESNPITSDINVELIPDTHTDDGDVYILNI